MLAVGDVLMDSIVYCICMWWGGSPRPTLVGFWQILANVCAGIFYNGMSKEGSETANTWCLCVLTMDIQFFLYFWKWILRLFFCMETAMPYCIYLFLCSSWNCERNAIRIGLCEPIRKLAHLIKVCYFHRNLKVWKLKIWNDIPLNLRLVYTNFCMPFLICTYLYNQFVT